MLQVLLRSKSLVRLLLTRSISNLPPDLLEQALENADCCKYAQLLVVCRENRLLAQGQQIHSHMLRSGIQIDDFLGQHLVLMFIKCGSISEARNLFDIIPMHSIIAWTAMVAAFAQLGHYRDSFRFFQLMQLHGLVPNQATFVSILTACTFEAEVRSLHEKIAERGFTSDARVGTALMNAYGRLGNLQQAWEAFDGVAEKDLIAWNALLSALIDHQQWSRILELISSMQLEGLALDKITFLAAIKSCSNLRSLPRARLLLARLFESGLQSAGMVRNAVVDMFGKCGSIGDAAEAFDRIASRDVVSWNTLLSAYTHNGDSSGALHLFDRMLLEGIKAESVTLATLLHSLGKPEFLRRGRRIHSLLIEQGVDLDVVMATALLTMYSRCGSVVEARRVFEMIEGKDVILWNTFISSLAQSDLFTEVFTVFRRMQLEGVRPNRVTFASVLDACASSASLRVGELVSSLVVESGLGSDCVLSNAITDLYSKCGCLQGSWESFSRTPQRDVVSWTTIISAFSQQGRFEDSVRLYHLMLQDGVLPTSVTLSTVLFACSGSRYLLEAGKRIHKTGEELGITGTEAVANAMVALYSECGEVHELETMFTSESNRDTVAWNGMVMGYTMQGLPATAVRIFLQMQQEGIAIDKFTLISVLDAISALRSVRLIESRACRMNMVNDQTLNTALFRAFSRCGSMEDARRVFQEGPKSDVVAWSAMVAAHAQHGEFEESLEVFGLMLLFGVMPSEVSVVSVLSACSHSGLVERGCRCFGNLKEDFGLVAGAEHWKCLVDLLGRAGRLGDAELMIVSGVKMESSSVDDAVGWSTLMAACSVQGELEIGERAAHRIIEMESKDDDSAAHVGLFNLYYTAAGSS